MTNKTSNKTTFEPLVFDDVRNGDDSGFYGCILRPGGGLYGARTDGVAIRRQ